MLNIPKQIRYFISNYIKKMGEAKIEYRHQIYVKL